MSAIRPYDGNTQPIRLPQVGSTGPTPPQTAPTPQRPADGVASTAGDAYRDRLFSVSSRIGAVERRNIEALKADDALSDLGKLLQDLRAAAKDAASVRAGDAQAITAAQQKVDEIAGTVATAAERVGGGLNELFKRNATGVTSVSDQVIVGNARAKLDPGERLDIDVEVTASAQTAGFLLSFGADNLNLGGVGASDGLHTIFTLEIGGADGARAFTFASGTSVQDVATAINSFSSVTGVKARLSGKQVRLDSTRYGSDEFVSVRVINGGAINASVANAGIYRLQESNANVARTDPAGRVIWASADGLIKDAGKDVQAKVNGGYAEGKGTHIRALSLQFYAEFNLASGSPGEDGVNAQNLGSFHAFTLVGLPLPRGIDDVRPGGPAAPAPGDSSRAEEVVEALAGEVSERREAIATERRALGEQIISLQSEMSRLISERNGNAAPAIANDTTSAIDAQTGALSPDRVAALLRARLFGQQG